MSAPKIEGPGGSQPSPQTTGGVQGDTQPFEAPKKGTFEDTFKDIYAACMSAPEMHVGGKTMTGKDVWNLFKTNFIQTNFITPLQHAAKRAEDAAKKMREQR